MRKSKFLCFCLCLVISLNLLTPIANAQTYTDVSLDNASIYENIALYGYQDDQMLYNLMIDMTTGIGEFAIVYSKSPNTMFNYTFDISEASTPASEAFWISTISRCFNNTAQWEATQISSVVQTTISTVTEETTYSTNADTTYFINELKKVHGAEYLNRYLDSTTTNGLTLRQYEGFKYSVSKQAVYYVRVGISVISFITGVLGYVATPDLINALNVFANAAGVIDAVTSIDEYYVWANWFRYVTINGGSYPYSMADKYMRYIGFVANNGDLSINTGDEVLSYDPSVTYYLTEQRQFEDAYDMYLEIGWQN